MPAAVHASKVMKRRRGGESVERIARQAHVAAEGAEVDGLVVVPRRKVSPERLRWAYDLVEENVKQYYETWNAAEKRRELYSEENMYLFVTDSNGLDSKPRPVAFASFRFTVDATEPVLYLYELQVEAGSQGKGHGKRLLNALYEETVRTQLNRIVLTVHKENTRALAFYTSQGYGTRASNELLPRHSSDSLIHTCSAIPLLPLENQPTAGSDFAEFLRRQHRHIRNPL